MATGRKARGTADLRLGAAAVVDLGADTPMSATVSHSDHSIGHPASHGSTGYHFASGWSPSRNSSGRTETLASLAAASGSVCTTSSAGIAAENRTVIGKAIGQSSRTGTSCRRKGRLGHSSRGQTDHGTLLRIKLL